MKKIIFSNDKDQVTTIINIEHITMISRGKKEIQLSNGNVLRLDDEQVDGVIKFIMKQDDV